MSVKKQYKYYKIILPWGQISLFLMYSIPLGLLVILLTMLFLSYIPHVM